MATITSELLTIDELARYLKVPRATVVTWRARGGGPPGMKVGRHVRYAVEDVVSWLDGRKSGPVSEPDDGVAAVGAIVRRGGAASAALSPTTVQAPSAHRQDESDRSWPDALTT